MCIRISTWVKNRVRTESPYAGGKSNFAHSYRALRLLYTERHRVHLDPKSNFNLSPGETVTYQSPVVTCNSRVASTLTRPDSLESGEDTDTMCPSNNSCQMSVCALLQKEMYLCPASYCPPSLYASVLVEFSLRLLSSTPLGRLYIPLRWTYFMCSLCVRWRMHEEPCTRRTRSAQ